MTLIRKKKKISGIDLKIASTKPKSTIVSNIVQQLIDQGYKGNILSDPNLRAMEMGVENHNMQNEDRMVEDIDFDTSEKAEETEEVIPKKKETKKEKAKKQRQDLEDRTENSKCQISDVQKKAKKMYSGIDEFIDGLRDSAGRAQDNPHLCRKLELIRKHCVKFVSAIQSQLPRSSTSLFVSAEENHND